MPPVAAAAAAIGGALSATAAGLGAAIGLGVGAPLAGTGLLAATSGVAGGLSLTGIAAQLIVGASLSAISRALAPSVRAAGGGTRVSLSFGEDVPASLILGRCATAGDLVYANAWGNEGDTPNEYLVQVIELADLPAALSRVWINGEYVNLKPLADFSHSAYSPGRAVEGYEIDGEDRLFVKFHDGTQTAADSYLLEKFGDDPDRPWLPDMIGRGVPYVIVTAGQRRGIHRQRPQVVVELIGSHYDRRRDSSAGGSGAQRWGDPATWRPSENPIVLLDNILRGIRDPLTGTHIWGGQDIGNNAMPASVWFAAMNECDRMVELAGGGEEPQYRAGCEVRADQEPAAVAEMLLMACQGLIANVAGQWHVRAGAPGPSVFSFTDDDLIVGTPDDFRPFPGLNDAYNSVAASYPEPEDGWKSKPAPLRASALFLAEDGDRTNTADLRFDAVPWRRQVQRLQKSALRDGRRFRRHSFSLPPEAWPLTVLDEVSWTSHSNGYDSKDWSLSAVRDLENGCVGVGLQERDPSDYDWSTADELPDSVGGWKRPPKRQQTAAFGVEAAEVGNHPAIRLFWQIKRNTTGIRYRVRLAGSTEIIATDGLSPAPEGDRLEGVLMARGEVVTVRGESVGYSRIENEEDGQFFISEGLKRSTAYEVQAIYEPVKGRAWSRWLPVTTPDVRIREEDLEDQIRDRINDARDAADTAAENAQQALSKANEVETLVSGISEEALADLHDIVDQLQGLDAGTVNEIRGIAIAGARKGWVTDPFFDRWTGTALSYWTTVGPEYLTKVAGSSYPAALQVDIPFGAPVASVQASSDVGGQMIASVDPNAEYIALGAIVRISSGLVGRLRVEWKNATTGNWARGNALGVTNWLGDFTAWGFAVDSSRMQSRELVVQRPVASATAIRVVCEFKRSGVNTAVSMRLDYLDVRALTPAEIKGFEANGYADAAIDEFRATIEGPGGAIAAMATTLRAEYGAADAAVSNTVVALANDVEAIAGTIDVVSASFGGRGLVPNGSFEDGVRAAGEAPAYWSSWAANFSVIQRGSTTQTAVVNAPSRYVGRISGDTTQRTARAHMAVRCKPGQIVRAQLQAAAAGGNATIGIRFRALAADAVTLVDSTLQTMTVGASWATSTFTTFTIPAGASYYETWVVRNAATTAITAFFTGVEATIGDEIALARAEVAITASANAQQAVTTMQTTVAAEFGTFAAFVQETATAVATANYAASAYVLRAVAGGGSAGLRLVAWDDPSGVGGAVVVDAPNLIAPGTISAGELVITDLGFNLVPDDQLQSYRAWGLSGSADGNGFWLNRDTGLEFASQGELRWDHSSGSGSVAVTGAKFPVRPGERLNCRYQYARTGAAGTIAGVMGLAFQKRDGTTVIRNMGVFSTTSGSVQQAARELIDVPDGCWSARWRLSVDKGLSNTDGRFGGFEAVKKSNASVLITPDGGFFADLSAHEAWIGTANIIDASIGRAKIIDAAVGTLKIDNFAVTDDSDVQRSVTVAAPGVSAAYTTYMSLTVNVPNNGTRVEVRANIETRNLVGGNLTWEIHASYGSSNAIVPGAQAASEYYQSTIPINGLITLDSGTYTFRLRFRGQTAFEIQRATMIVSQRKK